MILHGKQVLGAKQVQYALTPRNWKSTEKHDAKMFKGGFMEEEIKEIDLAKGALIVLLMIILSAMALTIAGLKGQLNALQQKADQESMSQQRQIDGLSLNIEAVRDEMRKGFESQQIQIDSQQEQITTQKSIQSNTLKAFIRYQKQQAETNEEFKEELKKD